MDLAAIFTTAFIVGLSGAMMPGPMLTVTINETSRRGFWSGPAIVAGHITIELILVIGLMFGLNQLIQQPAIIGTIGLVGGAVLLWMGWGIGKDTVLKRVSLSLTPDGYQASPAPNYSLSPFWAGITTSVFNPYWLLWWATIGAGYVAAASSLGLPGLAAFFTGHILSDAAWFSAVSFIVDSGRNFISNTLYRGILLVCSLFLGYLGLYFIYSGLCYLT